MTASLYLCDTGSLCYLCVLEIVATWNIITWLVLPGHTVTHPWSELRVGWFEKASWCNYTKWIVQWAPQHIYCIILLPAGSQNISLTQWERRGALANCRELCAETGSMMNQSQETAKCCKCHTNRYTVSITTFLPWSPGKNVVENAMLRNILSMKIWAWSNSAAKHGQMRWVTWTCAAAGPRRKLKESHPLGDHNPAGLFYGKCAC